MVVILTMVGTICGSCWADQDPVRPRGRPVDVQVEQAIPDGCARFQIHANPAQAVTIDSIYGSQYCQTDELKLIQDSAAVFDAATGKLRVPIVVKNVGTRAVRGLLKVRYDADSVQLFDANGNPVAGPTNIVGLGDSTLNNGRVAYWAFNQFLAPAGQQQVLFSGQTSGRRWLELQGTDWNKSVKIKLFTTARYGDPAPAAPVDTIPAWVLADGNMVKNSVRFPDLFAKNVVTVLFYPTATTAQRQAAIDSVGGIVVGGIRPSSVPEGRYLVHVASDSVGSGTFTAIARLEQFSYVLHAGHVNGSRVRDQFIVPSDGAGWHRASWGDPFKTTSGDTNWAAKFVRAPLAWGCSTGSSSVQVAVIDSKFYSAADVPLATSSNTNLWLQAQDVASAHGTRVASIIGARGNNGIGMAGMSWAATILPYDRGIGANNTPLPGAPNQPTVDRIPELVFAAGLTGAQVINVSLGFDWMPQQDSSSFQTFYADSVARRQGTLLSAYLTLLDAAGKRPIVVVAAGNNGIDAKYNGYPYARSLAPTDSIRRRVIVVHGHDAQRSPFSYQGYSSNNGVLIDVSAPGQKVWTVGSDLQQPTADQFEYGTSMAAPIVSGIAALLLSFDPSLSTDSVAGLVRAGAVASGRLTTDGYPIVDTYQSLKLAAQRPGAPLCGNRVFIKNDSSLTVERKLDDVSSDDAIGTWSTGWPIMFVEHGGKSISHGLMTPSNTVFVFGANGWTKQAGTGSPPNSPFFRSHEGVTHDGDTTLYSFPIPTANPTQVELYLGDSLGAQWRPKVTVPLAAANGAYVRALDLSRPRAFFAAQGTTSSTLYAIDFVTSTSALVPLSYTLDRVDWLGIAEDGSELRIVNRVVNGTTCNIDFVSLRTADYGTRRRRVTGSKGANLFCAVDGAIAPRVTTFGVPPGPTPVTAPPPWRRVPRAVMKGPTPP